MVLNLIPEKALPLWYGIPLSVLFLAFLTVITFDVSRPASRYFGVFSALLHRATYRIINLARPRL